MAIGWFNGEEIEYTGKAEIIYGGEFFEFTYKTGPKAGKTGWTKHPASFFAEARKYT